MSAILDVAVDPSQAEQRGNVDFNFFAGLCLPHVVRLLFPLYYIGLWRMLVAAIEMGSTDSAKKILRYVIGLPRGFTKTTFLKVLAAWLICYDKISFLLIICATDPLAEAFLNDLNDILQSENIEAVYGKWIPAIDNAGTKRGAYRLRHLILKARGAGTAVRGINEDNKRPDFVLCDDMQTKENDQSEAEREDLLNWFVGTLLKTVDQFFAIVVYVGNMYSDHCVLFLLKENHYWTSLITGAILEDGTSLWPELFSIEDLYDSFLHDESLGKADIWFAEIMNDPIESATSLLVTPLPVTMMELIPHPDAAFVTVDPAGFRDAANDNVIAAHYLINLKGYTAEMDGGIWDPGTTAENAITMAVRHEASLIAIEAYGYQSSLGYWVARLMTQEGITGINVIPIKRTQTKSKEQHIRAFISELQRKEWHFLRSQDRARFVWQASAYKSGRKKNKDDWMDCPAMGLEVRQQFPNLLSMRQKAAAQQVARVVGNNTPF